MGACVSSEMGAEIEVTDVDKVLNARAEKVLKEVNGTLYGPVVMLTVGGIGSSPDAESVQGE